MPDSDHIEVHDSQVAEGNTKALKKLRKSSGEEAGFETVNFLMAIAINDYQYENKLINCINDAEAFVNLLTEEYDFEPENVRFVCSGKVSDSFQKKFEGQIIGPANEEVIMNELLAMGERMIDLQKEESEEGKASKKKIKANFILYYSGHGYYNEKWDMGYWIPFDAKQDDYAKYIPNSMIGHYLGRFPTHHTFLVSDSCFSGSMFRTGPTKSVEEVTEKKPSRWGLSAGGYELVSDGSGKHSPFAEILLAELGKAKTIGVQDLCLKVRSEVHYDTKKGQTPRGERLFVEGDEGGEFVFRKKKDPQKYFEAGKVLLDLAEFRPEYERYQSAAKQFSEAYRLAKKEDDIANFSVWQAKALCAAGDLELAISVLEEAQANLIDPDSHQDLQLFYGVIRFLQIEDNNTKDEKTKSKKGVKNVLNSLNEKLIDKSSFPLFQAMWEGLEDENKFGAIYQTVAFIYGRIRNYSKQELKILHQNCEILEASLSPAEKLILAKRFSMYNSPEHAVGFYEDFFDLEEEGLGKYLEEVNLAPWQGQFDLAINHIKLGQTEKAEICLTKSSTLAKEENSPIARSLETIHTKVLENEPAHLQKIQKRFNNNKAIIIGINDYKGVKASLKTPMNDAKKLSEVLIEHQGFQKENVIQLLNPTKAEIIKTLEKLKKEEKGPKDRLLFFFAGHGISGEIGGEGPAGFLLPSDVKFEKRGIDLSENESLLSMDAVFESLDEINAHHTLLILDCCFAGSFRRVSPTRNVFGLGYQRVSEKQFDRYINRKAWEVLTSTKADQRASDSFLREDNTNDEHSPFARALIDALCGQGNDIVKPVDGSPKDGVITSSELFLYIRDQLDLYVQSMRRGERTFTRNYKSRDVEEEFFVHFIAQTPELFPLEKHQGGAFVFFNPTYIETDAVHRAFLKDIERKLDKFIKSGNETVRLDLGVAHELLGNRSKAIEELEIVESQNNKRVHYVLGRVLLEKKMSVGGTRRRNSGESENSENEEITWEKVVDHLTKATQSDPDNPAAHYYLGQAIRELVKEDSYKRAVSIYEKYLQAGAPIGYLQEVEEFLDSQDPKSKKAAAIKLAVSKGQESLKTGRLRDAIHAFQEAVQLGDIHSYYYLGKAFDGMRNHLQAVNNYQLAIRAGVKEPDLDTRFGSAVTALFSDQELIRKGYDALSKGEENKSKQKKLSQIEFSLTKLKHYQRGSIISVAFTPDGKNLLTGAVDKTVFLWSLDGKRLDVYPFLHRDSRLGDRAISYRDIEPPSDLIRLRPEDSYSIKDNSITFSPDRKNILVSFRSTTAYLWDFYGNIIRKFENNGDLITATAFSPDGQFILTGSYDSDSLRRWNLKGEMIQVYECDTIASVTFSPDGQSILIGKDNGGVELIDNEGNNILEILYEGDIKAYGNISFSPDGKLIITDYGIHPIDLQDEAKKFKGQNSSFTSVACSPDGKYIVTGSEDNQAYLWDYQGNLIQTFKKGRNIGHDAPITSVAFSPDSKFIFTGSEDHTARLWNLKGEMLLALGSSNMR